MMTRLLIECGHERNRNAGDEAYFAAMIPLFRKYLNPVEIVTFSDRPDRDRKRYNVEVVYSGGTILKSLLSIGKIVSAIKQCDIYVWGAGQILRDDTHILAPPYRLFRPFLAYLFGKKIMAYGAGIGPLESRKARFLAKHVLNRFTLITYRDDMTGRILSDIGIKNSILVKTVDPALGLDAADEKAVDGLMKELGLESGYRPLVGVAAYGPAFRGAFRGFRSLIPAQMQAERDMWQEGGKAQYARHVKLLAKAYDYMIQRYDAQLLFIVQDASGQGLDDRITRDIIRAMDYDKQISVISADDYPPPLLKGLMGRMEMINGGRMHSLILASGMATPILAVCYEEKIKAFGVVVDQQDYFIDGYRLQNEKELIKKIDHVWENRNKIRSQLQKQMATLRAEVIRNVGRLADLSEISGNNSPRINN
jgi:polysaccharide pyruvyl transferase WcaK-like protein